MAFDDANVKAFRKPDVETFELADDGAYRDADDQDADDQTNDGPNKWADKWADEDALQSAVVCADFDAFNGADAAAFGASDAEADGHANFSPDQAANAGTVLDAVVNADVDAVGGADLRPHGDVLIAADRTPVQGADVDALSVAVDGTHIEADGSAFE